MSSTNTYVKGILLFCLFVLASCSSGSDTTGVNGGNGNGNGAGDGGGSGKYLFAGTAHAIFRSTDSGATWTAMNAGPVRSATGFATYGNSIFASTYGGILVSTDNGLNWALSGDSVFAYSVYRYGNYLLAGTSNGMWRSSDVGKTWHSLLRAGGVCAFASMGNDIIGACYYSGGGSLYKSTDSGATWNQSTNGITAEDMSAVAIDSQHFYAASNREGGFLSSDKGQSWRKIDMNTPFVYAMVNYNGGIYAATDRAVMRGMYNGQVWRYLGTPSEHSESSLLFSGPYLFCGTSGGGIYRSKDTGATWQRGIGLTDSMVLSLGVK